MTASSNSNTDVLIVGAGPTGLTMACELARHGVTPRIIDKSPTPSVHSKAFGIHARTLELFETMGIVETTLAQGIGAGRGWPGFAYTYWVPWWPRVDGDRRIVVYRCQPDDVVSNHTHGATVDGVAVAFQGCFPPARGANCEPSDAQRIAFGELAAHLLARHHLASAALAPHSALGKADCPGSTLAAWITEFQRNGRLL